MYKLIILILFINTISAFAQWEKTSWVSDSQVGEFYTDDNIIITDYDEGFLISTDKGITWKYREIPTNIRRSLCKMILDGNNLYAATCLTGVFVSTDLGITWHERNNGFEVRAFIVLAINGDYLFAGTSGTGMYLSSDKGITWIPKNNGLNSKYSKYVESIAFNGNDIFIGTAGGIFLSTDMGNNWILKNNGLPEEPPASFFAFKNEEVFVILAENTEGMNKMYASTDYGNSWFPKKSDVFYDCPELFFETIDSNIFITLYDNIFLSTDFGNTWSKKNNGLPVNINLGISGIGAINNVLFASVGGDLYKTTDLGDNWELARPKAKDYGMVYSMTVMDGTLFIGAYRGWISDIFGDIFTSTDKGDTWNAHNLNNVETNSLAVNGNNIFASTNFELLLTTDKGITWNLKSDLFRYNIYPSAFTGDSIFPVINGRVCLTTDSGTTWIFKNKELPNFPVYYLAIYDRNIFVSLEKHGIYVSTDMGESWLPRNNGLPEESNILSFVKSGNNIFAGVLNKGIYASSNNGETWELRSNGLPPQPYTKLLYTVGNNIFAALGSSIWTGDKGGIYLSTDNGENWIKKNEGITNNHFSCFADDGEYIYVGTNGGGNGTNGDAVFKAKLSDFGITDVKEEDNTKTQQLTIYPLPSSDFINISNIGYDEKVEIFDVLGNKVMDTKYNGKINISSLPIGVYFIHTGSQRTKFIKGN